MGGARTEKQALTETLRSADPGSGTLCAGWDVRRLLAHLVQREQDHRGALADAVARPEPGREKHLGRLADRPARPRATPRWWTGSWPARPGGRRWSGPPTRSTCSST